MKERLEQDVRFWARILRLEDWDIEVEVISADRMAVEMGEKTQAYIERDRVRKCAIIKVKEGGTELDHDLVHEIVHILMDEFQAKALLAIDLIESATAREALQREVRESLERTINQIVRALLSLAAVEAKKEQPA